MLVVGLTGGIGSGKTATAALLADRGATVIDVDEIAREVLEPGEPTLAEVRARFGDDVITGDGRLDRTRLAEIVFGDPGARLDLEAITHPRIRSRVHERLGRLAAAPGGEPQMVVLDHPLLVETGAAEDLEVVVAVLAPEEVRRRRLVDQRGMDPDDVDARMASQVDDRRRRAAATHVIDNAGDLEDLEAQVDELWPQLVAVAGGAAP